MPATFPAITPGSKSRRSKSNRVLRADFGDGYAQTGLDGVNTVEESWDLTFDDYPKADIDTLVAFLDTQASYKSFYWTPPDESTPKLWRQDGEYSVAFNGPLTRSLSVKLKRAYSL